MEEGTEQSGPRVARCRERLTRLQSMGACVCGIAGDAVSTSRVALRSGLLSFFISSSLSPQPSSSPAMSAPSLAGKSSAYVCDTIPPPRLASDKSCSRPHTPSPPSSPPVTTFDAPIIVPGSDAPVLTSMDSTNTQDTAPANAHDESVPPQPPARKLCVRHQRMADEGTNLKLQQVSSYSLQTRRTPFSISIAPKSPTFSPLDRAIELPFAPDLALILPPPSTSERRSGSLARPVVSSCLSPLDRVVILPFALRSY